MYGKGPVFAGFNRKAVVTREERKIREWEGAEMSISIHGQELLLLTHLQTINEHLARTTPPM